MVAVSLDRKSTRLNSSHTIISYAVFCLKKNNTQPRLKPRPSRACSTPTRCVLPPQARPVREGRRVRGVGLVLTWLVDLVCFFFKRRAPPRYSPFSPTRPLSD